MSPSTSEAHHSRLFEHFFSKFRRGWRALTLLAAGNLFGSEKTNGNPERVGLTPTECGHVAVIVGGVHDRISIDLRSAFPEFSVDFLLRSFLAENRSLPHACLDRLYDYVRSVSNVIGKDRNTNLFVARRLEALERRQHFKRLDVMDRAIADGGRKLLEEVVRLDEGRLGKPVLDHHLLDVFPRHRLEGLSREELIANLLFALLEGGVAAFGDRMPCRISGVARLLEIDLGVRADRKLLFDVADPVAESPQLAA